MESNINLSGEDVACEDVPCDEGQTQRLRAAAAVIAADLAVLESGLNSREMKLVAHYNENADLAEAALLARITRRSA